MNKLNVSNIFFILLLFAFSCSESDNFQLSNKNENSETKFKRLSADCGFDFINSLDESELTNPFNYINLYTGGGVAIGDINNDGLQDVFMTSNINSCKLFLNNGALKFTDITIEAGCATTGWCTGVTMADVNNDGWQDIYVCKSYHDSSVERRNLLFINNKNNTFTEQGIALGAGDENYSIGASFFDYDKDGDLDLIVANHPRYRFMPLAHHYKLWKDPIKKYSSRLYRNDFGKFTETTTTAGILSYGFCLSLTTSDFNADGWPDIFITVDHDEPDMIFRNNKNGTFTNITDSALSVSSLSSMGIDVGDLNNDQFPEIVVAEMLAEDHYREKIVMGMQNIDRFKYLVDTLGYKYYQMHNFLYQNNANNTFSDISQLAGVSKSDWSWSCLFMDYNNDGLQDLYFSNGIYKELFHKDRKRKFDSIMTSFNGNMELMNKEAKLYAMKAPQTKISNYMYKNLGNINFTNVASDIGIDDKTITTGSAYGDLDNDGDLDLVTNDLNNPSFIYENRSKSNNFLRLSLIGTENLPTLGSKAKIEVGGKEHFRELLSTRGFQSSCEQVFHFGLGKSSSVEKLTIIWPNDHVQEIDNPEINKHLRLKYNPKSSYLKSESTVSQIKVEDASYIGIDFVHNENTYNDYVDQVLLPHKLSEYGPFISKGDINGDQLEDIYIGGPSGQPGSLYLKNEFGKYKIEPQNSFNNDKDFEDGHSLFIDVDNDKDLDLIVSSSGYEFPENDTLYQPRLYLNHLGVFSKAIGHFPEHRFSSSCVKHADIDLDGDLDIFLGGRLTPKKYPNPGTSAIFINNGQGHFSNVTKSLGKELEKIGMVKDAEWTDLNNDGYPDLIVVGEWMPISFFIQENGKFLNKTSSFMSKPLSGWWNCIESADIDNNGLTDFIIGNLGYNYKYKASTAQPFTIYSNDFDNNGSCDIVLGSYFGDKIYPVRGRTCSSEQIPIISEKFPTFEKYAQADLFSVYGEKIYESLKYEVNEFGSIILFQDSVNHFDIKVLPRAAQIAPINDVIIIDYNEDGLKDILVAGNLFQSEIETGKASSGTGNILVNLGNKKFNVLSSAKISLYLPQDVKSLLKLDHNRILVGANNSQAKLVIIEETHK